MHPTLRTLGLGARPAQFDEKDEQQHHVQQDAEECWSALVTALSQKMTLATNEGPTNLNTPSPELLPRMSALKRNLGDSAPPPARPPP